MSTQADFAAALLDPHRLCPKGLVSANGADPASRFAVYRNNVQRSLSNALAASYPVVLQLVGDEFFRAMAAVYTQHCPPQSPLINDFGDTFAAFVESFEPAASVPYLADVARLERLRVRAYHAADAQPLGQEQIAAVLSDPPALNELSVALHPSLSVLNSAFAVVAIWAAHQRDATPAGIDPHLGQSALVIRNGLDVEVFAITYGASTFIQHLQNGENLSDALQASPDFDLSPTLALLIRRNAITHLHQKVLP
ncbi:MULTISPECIES: DNA-binding domain-containing protein [unclassified Pseudomonas]|uniref:HvfC/BufC N-terminal domain-containing protein n=1 Tax=unclassified Pseudomonas TaxID=196821 RepID=UPI002AC90945|nr:MULTISPECIES: DNA-binding domain-containing protein [unclassified Pseudomonas]MEB0045823.1 DNA-binding domain-containing protein [Pseudomonas sp. Dout3]MEB0096689.1 DNA-binding domain-containing protein [Pseudomonas sp. DC1.2]WPX60190.1 DNA-binding domain-containing protein [Pseudomonas sp. DC1.2]